MKKILVSILLLTVGCLAQAQVSTTISTQLAQGVYGQVTIGNIAPQVVYQQPYIVHDIYSSFNKRPVYVYVPVEHQRQWGRYCVQYGLCGMPVYFVQNHWYHENYVTRDRPRHDNGNHYGERRKFKADRDDYEGFDHEGGHGHGHGHGGHGGDEGGHGRGHKD